MSPLALSLHFLQAQPDSRLVALAREGHTPAFEALVRRYRKELLAYCRRVIPRSGSAEDALQQALLQAWKALTAGAEVRDVRPWLYRIAHNVSLNQLRVPVSLPEEESDPAAGYEVHQLVEQRLQARAALAGVASLPDLQRQVFVSTALDGVSHQEVANTLGLSSGAVRGLIYRARSTLRSAAAALTPSPALHWAIRRAESRVGAARAISEMLAGGGGAGVAAVIAKGGAVLTLAGAVASAGGVIITHAGQHRRPDAKLAGSAVRVQAHSPEARFAPAVAELVRGSVAGAPAARSRTGSHPGHAAPRASAQRGQDSGSHSDRHVESGGSSTGDHGGGSGGGSDRGSSTGSSGGSDGGSSVGATIASTSDGGRGGSSGGSSGGSDAGSGGSSGTSTSTTSGSDGGTSGGGSSGDSLTGSDGGTGSSGGSTSSTSGSSGSGDTATTTH